MIIYLLCRQNSAKEIKAYNKLILEVLLLSNKDNSFRNKFKEEVASQLGINLKPGDNGNLSARDAGRIGGEMVRRMIKVYQEKMRSE